MQLGATLIDADRAEEAIEPLSEAIEVASEQLGVRHAETNVYRGWLGAAAALSGRDVEAAQLFEWCLEGLSTYEELGEDRTVLAMLGALVRVMEDKGLGRDAARLRAVADLGSAP